MATLHVISVICSCAFAPTYTELSHAASRRGAVSPHMLDVSDAVPLLLGGMGCSLFYLVSKEDEDDRYDRTRASRQAVQPPHPALPPSAATPTGAALLPLLSTDAFPAAWREAVRRRVREEALRAEREKEAARALAVKRERVEAQSAIDAAVGAKSIRALERAIAKGAELGLEGQG